MAMVPGVCPGASMQRDPGQELGVAGDRLELQPLVVGLEVGAVEDALVAEGELLLLVVDDQPGPVAGEHADVAGVVEVQVGEDHEVEALGADAELAEPGVEVLLLGDAGRRGRTPAGRSGPSGSPSRAGSWCPTASCPRGLDEHGVGGAGVPLHRLVALGPGPDAPAGLEQQPGEVAAHRAAVEDVELGRRSRHGLPPFVGATGSGAHAAIRAVRRRPRPRPP